MNEWNENKPGKYLIYARRSDPNIRRLIPEPSLARQIDFCRRYVASVNSEVVEVITDKSKSGSTGQRRGYRRIIKGLNYCNSKWDRIIVYRMDRMFTSLNVYENLFHLLQQKKKQLVSATEGNGCINALSESMMRLLCVMAETQLNSAVKVDEEIKACELLNFPFDEK